MATIIQLRGGTASQWTSANPVLAERELGIETDTLLYKLGDGVTAWNSLSYVALRQVDDATILTFTAQGATPATPAAGEMLLYAKSLGGRILPRILGPSGISTPLQPSFFQNFITLIGTNTTTTVSTLGQAVTSTGTISHPAVTESYGYMADFQTAATGAATAGTGNAGLVYLRGSVSNGANGFFYASRLAFPNSSYNESGASTGTRFFNGFTAGTLAAMVTTDAPTGNFCGFRRNHVNAGIQDTNWQFITRDNTTTTVQDTGLAFAAEKVYDGYIFCPPNGSTIYWRIDNITDETTAEGSQTLTLPGNTTLMRGGFHLCTVNAVARNIRMQRVYIESDR